jgi:hypothetical protein
VAGIVTVPVADNVPVKLTRMFCMSVLFKVYVFVETAGVIVVPKHWSIIVVLLLRGVFQF